MFVGDVHANAKGYRILHALQNDKADKQAQGA